MAGEKHPSIDYSAYSGLVIPLDAGLSVSAHSHPQHQLTWTPNGVLTMEVADFRWVVQRSRALWIPGGVAHAVLPTASVAMLSLYFEPADCPLRWDVPTVVDATGMVGPLLAYLVDLDYGADDRRARATAVLWDLMTPMSVATVPTILPTDPLALRIALALKDDPADPRDLVDWGREVGASTRTLSRRFRAETGVSFASWRTFERLNAALPLLGAGQPISRVAHAVGYKTASAFVTAFRRELGTTPAAYFGGGVTKSELTLKQVPRSEPAA
ncbi:helix-turn-helix transcriptional regulator [Actinoplanes sp. NPDC026619]|uniref:helix-turn-helix domain-containing protein n=1 Tax=Actinoplanes sp. NPDC026619 TaxID=3155798 RepID=UPI0033F97AD2